MGSPSTSLPTPTTEAGRAGLAAFLADPRRAVVALDFDGTLAPIVPDPDSARAHPAAAALLTRLARALGSAVIVTGRPAEVAVRLGGFAQEGGEQRFTVLGHYGAERWDAATGRVTAPPPDPGVAAVRRALPDLLAAESAAQGATVEDKGRSVAVHTRRAADPQGAYEALRGPLGDLASRHGLLVEPGRLVLELRPQGMDKGMALTSYLHEVGAGSVLYAGDDLGDLAAFDAVNRLRAEGLGGVLVCSGSTEVTALAERADLVVDGPDGVVGLLTAVAEAVGA
ncbi:trehalose-phosphatase [Streptomyces sp. NPDC059740]|uniref:trehalose-phosphatase n=1 Tax=Streptomyces sp. NPDC059740 TaxID=3346926 RepID=UPI003648CCAF